MFNSSTFKSRQEYLRFQLRHAEDLVDVKLVLEEILDLLDILSEFEDDIDILRQRWDDYEV